MRTQAGSCTLLILRSLWTFCIHFDFYKYRIEILCSSVEVGEWAPPDAVLQPPAGFVWLPQRPRARGTQRAPLSAARTCLQSPEVVTALLASGQDTFSNNSRVTPLPETAS